MATLKLTHPLKYAVVTVRVTRGFAVRLWLAKNMIRLAARIAGGVAHIEEEK